MNVYSFSEPSGNFNEADQQSALGAKGKNLKM